MVPHLFALGLVKEASIGMGRQLLASCLIGQKDERTAKLRLDRLAHFGSLPLYDIRDALQLIDSLIENGLLEQKPLPRNKFIKVLSLTKAGHDELKSPSLKLESKKNYTGYYSFIEGVTEEDKKAFSALDSFLKGLSDEQKKAVICNSRNILCVAGAGSGKTKVLTRRIWYLSMLKSVEDKKLLAITFTRKARAEMLSRIGKLMPTHHVAVETFNSFCEKILRERENEVYGKKSEVLDYSKKIRLVSKIISEIKLSPEQIISSYYTSRQQHSNDRMTLFLGFVNDIFSVLDYQANYSIPDDELTALIEQNYLSPIKKEIIKIIFSIKEYKAMHNLRDYTDQLLHVLEYFRNTGNIPKFEHILVDEYQDINALQFELLSMLNPENMFAVGDPRQSIYGWRGSRIDYILDFERNYKDAKIIQLTTNYRSCKKIVDIGNSIIEGMKLPEVRSSNGDTGKPVSILKLDDDESECLFVSQSILSMQCKRNEIFVLARTNRQIEKIAEHLAKNEISYLKRTVEETNAGLTPKDGQVTLSTIHAIKGMEAEVVYLIGANSKNHPCRASEHPLLEAVRSNECYDKNSEELRLMYVAITRAKKKLIITYTGTVSPFLEKKTLRLINEKGMDNSIRLYAALREFRQEESRKLGILPHQVFSDNALEELCEKKPLSIKELENVKGFGSFKKLKLGERIIEIIENGY